MASINELSTTSFQSRCGFLNRPLAGNRSSDGWLLIALAAVGLISPWLSAPLHSSASSLAWLLDLLTHGQWFYLAALWLGVALIISRQPIGLLALLMTPLPWLSAAPALNDRSEHQAPGFRVAVANLKMAYPPVFALADWLDDAHADVVILLECTARTAAWLDRPPGLRHHFDQPSESPFGICLRSKWPLVHRRVELDTAGVPRLHAELDWHGRPVILIALHPMPPLSQEFHQIRNRQLRGLFDAATPNERVILAGDFNASPWSSAFAGLKDTSLRRASGLRPTWPSLGGGWLGTPIDQVFASTAWHGAKESATHGIGSDHRAVTVTLW